SCAIAQTSRIRWRDPWQLCWSIRLQTSRFEPLAQRLLSVNQVSVAAGHPMSRAAIASVGNSNGVAAMHFDDPSDAARSAGVAGCSCGAHRSPSEHDAAAAMSSDARAARLVESAVLRALLPEAGSRRAFLTTVGASTALAAIAQFFPL